MRALLFLLLLSFSATAQRPSPEVRRLVRKLDTKWLYVSYCYKPSHKYCSRFRMLCSTATTDELLALTQHRKAVIRGYAAQALVQRNYAGIGEVMERFIASGDIVHARYQCTRQAMPVYWLMYQWAFFGKPCEATYRHVENTFACRDSLDFH